MKLLVWSGTPSGTVWSSPDSVEGVKGKVFRITERPRAKGREWKWKSRTGELYACNGPSSFQESAAGNPQRFHKQLLKATTRCWYTLE